MKATESLKSPEGAAQPEIVFPYTRSRPGCSVSVKIYKTPRDGYDAFTLIFYQDGQRKRVLCKSFDVATREADEVLRRFGSRDVDVLELRSADRASYQRAREILDPLKVSLEVAAAEYAHLRRMVGDTPFSTVAEFYVRKHARIEAKPVKQVVAEFLAAKEADGCGARYLQCLRYNLGAFEKRFQGNLGSVVGAEIDAWLRSSGLSPRTRNNIRTSLHTLFKFAEGRRYLSKDHDELNSVAVINDRDGDIEVFTVAEFTEVLCCADEPMIPFLVLGAFAGIRHAEIQRLEWKDVRFDDGIIELGASKAKTASRRLVPILPNLKEWLLKFRKPAGLIVSHRNVAFELHLIAKRANERRRTVWAETTGATGGQLKSAEDRAGDAAAKRKVKSKLRSQKGQVPPGAETAEIEGWEPFAWKHNALRHSFISYRLATIQNTAQVALEAGNSPQMIFQHYRELVRSADAEKWFALTPAVVEAARAVRESNGGTPGNVVALTAAA